VFVFHPELQFANYVMFVMLFIYFFFLCLGSVTVDKSSNSRQFTFNDVVLKTPNGKYFFLCEQNL